MAYKNRGHCREARGDSIGAKADYAEAARLDPPSSKNGQDGVNGKAQ